MSAIKRLETAKKILEEQQQPIEVTKDHSDIKKQTDNLRQAIMDDIKCTHIQMVSDTVEELYYYDLSSETANSTSAKEKVVEAIFLLEQGIARQKSLEQLHSHRGNNYV